MTTITFYPIIQGGIPIMQNIIKYATDAGLTINSWHDYQHDTITNTSYAVLSVSQTLTLGQQNAITNLFQGTCRIVFT